MAIGARSGTKPASDLRTDIWDCFLTRGRERPSISRPQKVVDLALSPAMILSRKRIDARIDADVAKKELRALDKVDHLINGSPPETTCGGCHRRAPSLPRPQHLAFTSPVRNVANGQLAL
jgi:hypothetical protein